jgi:hypothetical protein
VGALISTKIGQAHFLTLSEKTLQELALLKAPAQRRFQNPAWSWQTPWLVLT